MPRILIFDDDSDILELCSIILREKGFDARGHTTCRDVINLVEDFKPQLILMDNWIPDTGGVEATNLLKQNPSTASIPVIFFSASNDVKEYARQAKADFYLRKPFDIKELENVVHAAVGSEGVDANSNRVTQARTAD